MLKEYYRLAKPGIVYGNAVTAAAGFLLASHWHFPAGQFAAMLVGISFVMASGCVFNNYLDRGLDEKMARTKNRPLVQGTISPTSALLYAILLGLLGFFLLGRFTNPLTTLIALAGLIFYVILYGLAKRHSPEGVIVGSISGAVPPVVGYCAASGRFDLGALILFLILIFWQMPHFYAIALYRKDEYAAAGVPVLPIKRGIQNTKIQILEYILAFIVAVAALTVFGYAGYTYLIVSLLLGLGWLWVGMQGFRTANTELWARQMFRFSLRVIMGLSLMIAVGSLLP